MPWERYASEQGPWTKYGGEGAPDVGKAFQEGRASEMIPGTPPQPKPNPNEPGVVDSLVGGGLEATGAMASAIPAQLAGNAAGAVRRFLPGGDMSNAQQTAGDVSKALTYQPRGERGKRAVDIIGQALSASRLEGLNPAMGAEVRAPGAAVRGVQDFGRNARVRAGEVVDELPVGDLPQTRAPQSAMSGVGSAETAGDAARRERAASLPVPLNLSKGQASRDFDQLRFERETAKDGKLGKPIRELYADQNEKILGNFDAWVDQTGAQAPSLQATGKTVSRALVKDADAAKARINAAYKRARDAGELARPVSTQGVVEFVENSRSAARNAPIVSAVEDELVRLGGATRGADGKLVPGKLSINDLEEVRKMVNDLAEPNTPNGVYGGRARAAIDAATEGAGGKLYQEARAQRKNYARKFEDHAIVSKLLNTKRGTKDRQVALEDVFKHSVLDSSLEDLQSFGRVVKSGGPEGQQAWREIQGATIQYIKDEATKGIARDIRDNPIASPATIHKHVRELDRDGKLDYIFGKANAQQVRDIADIAIDVHTAPPGAINSSSTTAVLLQALREIGTGHFSVGTAKAVAMLKREIDSRATKRRVRDAVEEPAP